MTLGAHFDRAVREVGGRGATQASFSRLVACYAEPHRHYHTLEHVAACLAWLERVEAEAERPAEVVLAIFFHDAVYARGPDDEARSAEMAERVLAALEVPREAAARVGALVLSTAAHEAEDGDAALLSDIDLSILAAPPDVYARYAAGVRAEHAELPDAVFESGRAAFLRHMLGRQGLFATPAFRQLEPMARNNLASELRALVG